MTVYSLRRFCLLFALLAAFVFPVFAQNQNDSAVFRLDVTQGDDTQSLSAFTTDAIPNVGRTFTVTVVLDDAQKLMGANCDLDFDESVLEVVSIEESRGDINFDGRVNIFDVREIGTRFGATPDSTELDYSEYFDLSDDDELNSNDVLVVAGDDEFNVQGIFLTSNNPNSSDIRESVEIFENPALSNQKGFVDDIVFVLLRRPDSDKTPDEFSFTGDARIAEITFQAKEGFNGGETSLSFISDSLIAIDSGTTITTTSIDGASDSASGLSGQSLTVNVAAP